MYKGSRTQSKKKTLRLRVLTILGGLWYLSLNSASEAQSGNWLQKIGTLKCLKKRKEITHLRI